MFYPGAILKLFIWFLLSSLKPTFPKASKSTFKCQWESLNAETYLHTWHLAWECGRWGKSTCSYHGYSHICVGMAEVWLHTHSHLQEQLEGRNREERSKNIVELWLFYTTWGNALPHFWSSLSDILEGRWRCIVNRIITYWEMDISSAWESHLAEFKKATHDLEIPPRRNIGMCPCIIIMTMVSLSFGAPNWKESSISQ